MSAPRVAIRGVAISLWAARQTLESLLMNEDALGEIERRDYVLRARETLKKADAEMRTYFQSQGWNEDLKLLEGKSPHEHD